MKKDNLLKTLSHPNNFFLTLLGFCTLMLVPLFSLTSNTSPKNQVEMLPITIEPVETEYRIVNPNYYNNSNNLNSNDAPYKYK